MPTRCRFTIVSDLKSPATSCVTINGSEKFTVSHLSVRAIEMRGVSLKWIRMKTTLGQTSSYNFQVRAKVHRTISPFSFHSSGEAVPGESRGFRPQFSLFHPKRHSCYHPSSGWKMNTNSKVFLLSSLFWALLYFPEWLPWEIPKLVHDQGHCVDQWENIIWKCFLPNALFFLSGTQVSQDASKDLTQNGDAGTGYKSLFSASSSRWLFS